MKIRTLRTLFLLLFLLPAQFALGQQLVLHSGEQYVISQSFNQNTFAESSSARGNVSLDLSSSLLVEVLEEVDSSGWLIRCQYQDLNLSLFSPNLDITISSETRGISLIMDYMDRLEEHQFTAQLSPNGELMNIENLDEHILDYYNIEEKNLNEQDLIIKTIKEAYGEDALTGFFNLTMHVYCEGSAMKCEKDVSYAFNANSVFLKNSFFIQPDKDGQRRIQGLGIIIDQTEVMEFEGGSISTSLNGSQTYDHLYEAGSGWLIEGFSKQKVYLKSVFHGSSEMPDGLEVPSVTETDYYFWGERREKEKGKSEK